MAEEKPINRVGVTSSNIKSIGHCSERNCLDVEFAGGGVFRYEGVPAELFESLKSAESVGSFFHKHIRNGGFKHRKVG
jgi:hypothetical protein